MVGSFFIVGVLAGHIGIVGRRRGFIEILLIGGVLLLLGLLGITLVGG